MSDKLIVHAHLALAYDKNSFEYHASCRHLALIAGVNHMTAIAATKRLIELSFLVMTEPHEKETFFANKYLITMHEHIVQLPTSCIPIHTDTTMYKYATRHGLPPLAANYIQTRDVFWNGVDWKNVHVRKDEKTGKYRPMPKPRLGRRSGEIYAHLLNQPATAKELTELLGCHKSTIHRSLEKMQSFEMVLKQEDGKWRINPHKEFSEVEQALHLLGKHHEQYRTYVEESKHQEKFVTDEEYRAECKKWSAKKKKMKQAEKAAIRNSTKRQQKVGK
jgi:DNA-binding transcriptional regulator GbsR (MarR family)